MTFRVGDRVKWVSSSNGSTLGKAGDIMEIVKAGNKPILDVSGFRRIHESYVVEVKIGNRKPRLYWPRVSKLEAAK